jgi:CrcB protein
VKTIGLIFGFGGLGCVLRYLVSSKINPIMQHIPLGTLFCNVLGSVLLCFLAYVGAKQFNLSGPTMTALTVGLMGGLTTYSSFNLEVFALFQKGEIGMAMFYFLATAIVSMLGAFAVYKFSL